MAKIHKKTFDISDTKEGFYAGENYFHIDDLIALPIQALNRKGYITEFCCAGHPFAKPYDSSISFKEGIWLPSLPPKFVEDKSFYKKFKKLRIIHKYVNYDCYNEHNAFEFIRAFLNDNIEAMEALYKWVIDLPLKE